MDKQDKQRFVQQYVQRQKAYLPTYTAQHLWNECQGTPVKPLRSDQFGFDTPVLRPRVPVSKTPQSQPIEGPSKSQAREADSGPSLTQEPAPVDAPLETQDLPVDNRDNKSRLKKKKVSTPIDTDSERAARLADRRERKKKKRAIVNPPQKREEDNVPATAPKKGRANGQKAKNAAGLALLYGFSATNVTKDRLTLKPAPSLGVFGKGKASTKKKITATRKSPSNNETFSETAFLNKPSKRAADHSRVDSDDGSVVSISNTPTPRAICNKKPTMKNRGKCAETAVLKTPASIRTAAASEVWDIELQSKLPSSARDVSSDLGANGSASVVLDLRGAEWRASLEKEEEHRDKTRVRNLSATPNRSRGPSVVRISPLASDLHDESGVPQIADEAPSVHPSHSASQVGQYAADIQPSDLRLVTSKYFIDPNPVSVPQLPVGFPQTSRSDDSLYLPGSRMPTDRAQDAAMDVQPILRVASPINSLTSAVQPMLEFQTPYDMVPLDLLSDGSPYDDSYAHVDTPLELHLAGRDHEDYESSVVEMHGTLYHGPRQVTGWNLYRSWRASSDLADNDAENIAMEGFEGCDPLAPEHEDNLELEIPVAADKLAEYDPGEEQFFGPWTCIDETGEDFAMYEDGDVDGSICWDGESAEGGAEFLEGRALLLGVPEWQRYAGLAQAEMDVAGRLRDHWRPLRLS